MEACRPPSLSFRGGGWQSRLERGVAVRLDSHVLHRAVARSGGEASEGFCRTLLSFPFGAGGPYVHGNSLVFSGKTINGPSSGVPPRGLDVMMSAVRPFNL